jgi:hypothetical protein
MAGASNAAHTFLAGTSCKFADPGKFVHPYGPEIKLLTKRPQLERLEYLRGRGIGFPIPPGGFVDYFGFSLAILARHWFKIPVSGVLKVVSPGYWSEISSGVEKLEQWEELVSLLELSGRMEPHGDVYEKLWQNVPVKKYLQTGMPPLVGTPSRLLICAALFRSDLPKEQLETIPDMRIYLKLRSFCDFSPEASLVIFYNEIWGELPTEARRFPKASDVLAIRHPMTNLWVNATVSEVASGRVTAKVDDVTFVQLPMSAVFWDGRCVWREMRTRSDDPRPPSGRGRSSFLTIGETFLAASGASESPIPLAIPLPPNASKHIMPTDPQFLLKSSREKMRTCPFMSPTPRRPATAFRGIADPVPPPPHVFKRGAPTRRPTQMVAGVANVAFGREIAPGRKIRKFHVKVRSMLSEKVSYVWINEDDIPNEDVEALVEMYRNHIQAKMVVMPRNDAPPSSERGGR